MKKLVVFVLVISLLTPVFASEENIGLQAIMDARRDASTINKSGAFASGFLCGIFGVAYTLIDTPQIPVENLMGKPPEYVSFYTAEYQGIVRKEKVLASSAGCVLGAAAGYLIAFEMTNRAPN